MNIKKFIKDNWYYAVIGGLVGGFAAEREIRKKREQRLYLLESKKALENDELIKDVNKSYEEAEKAIEDLGDKIDQYHEEITEIKKRVNRER